MKDKIKNLENVSHDLKKRIKEIERTTPTISPITDGIINIEKYVKSDFRILWILKESNDLTRKEGVLSGGGWDLCKKIDEMTWSEQKKIKAGQTVFRRLSFCSYYILMKEELGEKTKQMSEEMWDAFKSTAYINVKKLPGISRVKDDVIQAAYDLDKEILHDQIKAFNPNIIIGCNTLGFFSKHFKFNRQDKKSFKDLHHYFSPWKGYYPQKDRLYIDTSHPLKPGITDEVFLKSILNCFNDWVLNYWGK